LLNQITSNIIIPNHKRLKFDSDNPRVVKAARPDFSVNLDIYMAIKKIQNSIILNMTLFTQYSFLFLI
jgi:hypothetical protein